MAAPTKRKAPKPKAHKSIRSKPRGATPPATPHRIYGMSVARVYPLYVAKAERKGRTKAEVDEIIRWLTGYTQRELQLQLKQQTDFEGFFAQAARLNPVRRLISGLVCGVRVESIKEPLMQEIRYLDKLIDELAAGRAMDKILRKPAAAEPKLTRTTTAAAKRPREAAAKPLTRWSRTGAKSK